MAHSGQVVEGILSQMNLAGIKVSPYDIVHFCLPLFVFFFLIFRLHVELITVGRIFFLLVVLFDQTKFLFFLFY